jgi:hypothetical protein
MNARNLVLCTSLLLAAGMAATPAAAAGCRHTIERAATESAGGLEVVEIFALAGELEVRGSSKASDVVVRGDGCTSREDMLAATDITLRRLGERLQILVEMPDISGETERRWRDEYAVMDLQVDLPDSVAVIVHDSSGGMLLRNLARVEVIDSSGDIEIDQVAGPVLIPQDSSGDIEIRGAGEVTIQVDSSGEIHVEDADAVTIANDTSGGITLKRIQGNVLIGNDSSGGISVESIGGSFVVENDTSGGIRYRDVAGNVSIPEHREGG